MMRLAKIDFGRWWCYKPLGFMSFFHHMWGPSLPWKLQLWRRTLIFYWWCSKRMLIGTLLKRNIWYVLWATAGLVWYGTGINRGLRLFARGKAFRRPSNCAIKMSKMNPYTWQMVRKTEHNEALNLYIYIYMHGISSFGCTYCDQTQKFKSVSILQFIA